MSDYKDIIFFFGGMDSDTELRLIAKGDYLEALNLVSGTEKQGSQVKMKGNTLVPYTLPTGRNKCIGSLKDIKRNAVIFFVFNELGNHSILHYFCATNTIEPIFLPFTTGSITFTTNFLGFTEFNKIHSSDIIDDILIWTDNSVPMRKINIQRAKDFMNQLAPSAANDPYSNLIATGTDEQKIQFIQAIKYPPLEKPTHILSYDIQRKTSLIRGAMIQVRYRWLYDDNEPSTWSTGSYTSLPFGEENANGLFVQTSANNVLIITINSGHPTVKKIEVAFRFSNTSDWYKLDTPIEKFGKDRQQLIPDLSDYTFNYYNDQVLLPVSADESSKLSDAIPLLSGTLAIGEGNRLFCSNNLEGYDNPELDVSTTVLYDQVSMGPESLYNFSPGTITPQLFTIWTLGTTYSFVPPILVNNTIVFPNDPSLIEVGTLIKFTMHRIQFGGGYDNEYKISYTITENDLDNYPFNLQDSLFDYIVDNAAPLYMQKVYRVKNGVSVPVIEMQHPSNPPPETVPMSDFNVIPPTMKQTAWKTGSSRNLGIVYYDEANRDGGVVTNNDLTTYVQYYPEFTPNTALSPTINYKPVIQVTINHIPPVWAKKYQIVASKNSLSKYVQFLVKGNFTYNSLGNIEINVNYLAVYILEEHVVTTVAIDFQIGDRIRFKANAEKYVGDYIEAVVLAYDESDTGQQKLTVAPFSQGILTNNMTRGETWNGFAAPTEEWVQAELFAYKLSTENVPYFEIGVINDILDPGTANRAHAANEQNQTSSLPAIINLDKGDCYIYRRYMLNNTKPFFVESQYYSDFILGSDNFDYSRVQVVTNSKQKRYEQQIRYGGRYFPDTEINLLLSFNAQDGDNLETTFGPINKIISVGYTLKCLQTKKNTSIYINRNMIFTADGNRQITTTNEVLGTRDPSELDYGTEHPESVFRDDRQVFFYDVNSGSFIQDSANGMFPISDYKFSTYFRNKSRQIQNRENVFVYTQVDNFNNQINVSFIDESGLGITTSETVLFSQRNNRWTSKASYLPDYYASNAMVFMSFRDGSLYVHNTNDTRCLFYGVQYRAMMKFSSSPNPYEVKVFDSIAVDSNQVWYSPNLGMITIPAQAQIPGGMSSRLIESKFKLKEQVYYTEFLRDALTPNQPSQEVSLLEGRRLRGHSIVAEIENNTTSEVVLFGTIINSTKSNIS